MKRTILKVLAPPYSGKCELLECFLNGSNPHSCAMINCNLSNEKELLQVFENQIANLCVFQLLIQRRSLENYVNALRKSENTFIIDHTLLEVVKLHTIAYAQTHFISDFSFGLCDEEMREAVKKCVTLESDLQCDVAYIYLNVSPEKCFENMKYHSSGEPLQEESTLHNLFHLFHLHSDMNPSKKLILNLEEGNKDNQSAINEFYWCNIVKEVCKMKCGKD